jgi:protein-disulfide isomerase
MKRRHFFESAIAGLAMLGSSRVKAQTNDQTEFLLNRLALDPNAPFLGNPAGVVTLIEFFDYNCPICRAAHPAVDALLEADTGVRFVFRHWPIFGPDSTFAARAALAADKQGMFPEFHDRLMKARGRITMSQVETGLRELKLDLPLVMRDMDSASVMAHLSDTRGIASILGFAGTPVLVAAGRAYAGAADLKALQDIVEKTRG